MNDGKETDKPWYKNIQNLGIIISLVIAIISLVISGILAANELKSFELDVYANGVYIVPNSGGEADILNLIVPIGFVNRGNIAGVIEEVYLIVNYQGIDIKYDPMEELDLFDLIKNRQLNINYVAMTPYMPFLLEGNKEKSKAILFFSEPDKPGMKILPGNYTINIYIKTQNDNKAVNKKTIRIYINNDTIVKHQKEYFTYILDNNRWIYNMAPPKEN